MIASSFSILLFLVDYIAVLVFVFETNKLPINNSLIRFHASFVCSLKIFRNHQIWTGKDLGSLMDRIVRAGFVSSPVYVLYCPEGNGENMMITLISTTVARKLNMLVWYSNGTKCVVKKYVTSINTFYVSVQRVLPRR